VDQGVLRGYGMTSYLEFDVPQIGDVSMMLELLSIRISPAFLMDMVSTLTNLPGLNLLPRTTILKTSLTQ
jgi:hypothetical protein